jgi:hypothetical protein
MVLVTRSSSGVQLQVTIDVKWVSQMSQSLVLVGQPTLIGHVCEIILGQSTLASSRLFNIQHCVL